MEVLLGLVFFIVLIMSIMFSQKEDPKDSVSGRWGIKTGKFLSGNWGGEEWGEKDKK